MQESIAELGTTIGRGITSFAASNLKDTNLPAPAQPTPVALQHKTLPHALGRAATSAANVMQQATASPDDRLIRGLSEYAGAWQKIADARVQQDEMILAGFLEPWQATLTSSIAVAMKARQAVRLSRLELDAAKQTYVSPPAHTCSSTD